MGMDSFAPGNVNNNSFIVMNVSPEPKTVRVFHYPINYLATRNLISIPGVGESDIRASLLKGELRTKILAKELVVLYSDIDLLQFNLAQKTFLQNAGITIGLDVSSSDDWLLDNDPVAPNNIYAATYSGPQIQQEAWSRQNATLIKQINYTFTGAFLTQEVRTIYDTTGLNITGQLTIVYTYTGATLTSYTATRNV